MNKFSVIVTRPNKAGEELCQLIEKYGGKAFHFPTIAILPPDDLNSLPENLKLLPEQDWLIFISPQAVYASHLEIQKKYPHLPKHLKIAAVGGSTAQALQEVGYPVTVYPQKEWGSLGLIDLPEFKKLAHTKVMLVRGQGGRELLAETLQSRGANIIHLVVYQRALPQININPYLNLLKQNKIDVIVCASFTAVHHLKVLLGEEAWPYIKNIPLIVVSRRIKMLAQDLGFQTLWEARNASHEAVMEIIEEGLLVIPR